jgi:hypothetical protein
MAIFERGPNANHYAATAAAAGPWSKDACHGGAPSALIVHTAEAVPTLVPMDVMRVTVELLRPVPIGALAVRSNILREGKKLQLVEIDISANDVNVAKATVLKLRRAPLSLPSEAQPPPFDREMPDGGQPTSSRVRDGFVDAHSTSAVKGGFLQPGPAAVWFRLNHPLVEDQPTSGAMRAVAAADSGNGISGVLPFDRWSFINADLTVSFFRNPIGEWILVDAETVFGPDGRALTRSRLADLDGWFGQASQTLLIEQRSI